MAAACAAKMENPDVSVCIVEKGGKPGRKLLATGNGRCNFTNSSCDDFTTVLDFFRKLGVMAREEEQGRIYPFSGRAEDVLRAFELFLGRSGVRIITGFAVDSIDYSIAGEMVVSFGMDQEVRGRKVLLAVGGKAGSQYGCTGDGYKLSREAGHTVTKIIPALSPLECAGDFEKIGGCRAKASVTLLRKGEALHSEKGEVQFGDYGLSGICVMNLSRYIRLDEWELSDYKIACDFVPEMTEDEAVLELQRKSEVLSIPYEQLLSSIVPRSLGEHILGMAGGHVRQAAHFLKNTRFTVSGVKGWKFAQCTSGGVLMDEIDPLTMESKIVKGLFFAGEILDYDGPCGGYNLNNAWITGIKAGRAMAKDV